jgi:ribonuclease HI
LLSDSGDEDQDKGLRGGQKKRLKSDQAEGERYRDEAEDRNSEEADDDDERFQATQTIPTSPLLPAPAAPLPLSRPSTAAATATSTAIAAGAAGAAGLAGGAARVITSGTLFFDGGSRGNPGVAGCGAVMYDDTTGAKIWSLSAYVGHKTNNQAEYAALCFGLEEALRRGVTSIQAFGDSTLVVKQLEGAWKVKNAGMKVWHDKALALKKKFKRFRIGFVPREENGVADALANEGMDGRREGGAVVVEED